MRRGRGLKLCAVVGSALIAVLLLGKVTAAATACGFTTQRVQCGDLACDRVANICIACRTDSDCYPGAMHCDLASGKCRLRSFISLFGVRVALALLGAFSICSVAVIAGVGGGGILMPMFCGLMEISMQSAVGMSQSTVCGQCTLNMYLVVQQKHPDRSWDRPLVNYQYLSLLLPLGLMGTLIGGILSKFCPDILRLVLLFVLLSLVLYRTVRKMKAQYKQDTHAQQAIVQTDDANTASHRHNYGSNGVSHGCGTTKTADGAKRESREDTEAMPVSVQSPLAIERAPQPQYPKQEIAINVACLMVVLLFGTLRTHSACGGFMYWVCVLIPLTFLGTVFYFNREKLRQLAESDPEQLRFAWTRQSTVMYPMVAVVAGASAAVLGIGGGLVLGFVLNEVGIVPQEASVTSGMATFFIALSSALELLVTGRLEIDFGIAFSIAGLCSSMLGHVFMTYIKKHDLNYLIIGSLAFTVVGSLVALGSYGIYNTVIAARSGGSVMAFGRLCSRVN
ncbi:hypothetical protein LSCM1_01694 [Leishmania martiniquensis]|uniref:Sulfite exporter TauE/SafE n=1 Tax=Leishmania martiniquensis TaxID=1580590 RepID=A0A836KH18_9TRYP|nr:hypothetical protein LSCM1_01694 [Leishmania martiniquensis]